MSGTAQPKLNGYFRFELLRDQNERIVERVEFRFAILDLCEFHESAHLKPMRKTALLAGII
jgi:hypothetical protein